MSLIFNFLSVPRQAPAIRSRAILAVAVAAAVVVAAAAALV